MRPFLKHQVGDGEHLFMWHDHWHLDGKLLESYGHRIKYDLASNSSTKFSSFILEWALELAYR